MSEREFGGRGVADVDAHHRAFLVRSEQLRAVRDGLSEKTPMVEISAKLAVSVELVEELAALLGAGWNADASPYELIVKAAIEGTSRQELITALVAWEWPEGGYPEHTALYLTWTATARAARLQGLLAPDEVAEIDHLRSGATTPFTPVPRPTAAEKEAHLRKRSADWLERVRRHREILKAVLAGASMEAVGERFGERVSRVRSVVENAVPGAEVAGPEELITAAWLDPGADRRAMVVTLSDWDYTDDLWAPEGLDGRLQGTWSEVEHCRAAGMLSHAEYREIADRRGVLLPHPLTDRFG